MKKGVYVAIVVVVLVILAGSAYALFRNGASSPSASSNNVPAVNNAVLVTKTDASLGQYLAEPNGTPLYTYNADTSGASNCTGTCLATWPPYQDTGATSGLPTGVGTITRTDNSQVQFTYNGLPLYTFVSDSGGQPTGNGVSDFNIAKPVASPTTNPSSSGASTNTTTNTNTSNSSGYPY